MTAAVVDPAADALRSLCGKIQPKVALVLGSGMADITDLVENLQRLPFGQIPGMPEAKVQGHSGEVIAGTLSSIPILCQSGRVHLYEAGAPSASVLLVRAFARIGVKTLILTNAAGGLRRTLRPGDLMLIGDHINLSFRSVLAGPVVADEERFPDMSDPYDPQLKLLARETAKGLGIGLQEGVYAGVLGPSYETAAEIRMLERLGADAVGMSTVPEVVAARANGMRCLGFSLISNLAAGLHAEPLTHSDVLSVAGRATAALGQLLKTLVPRL
ncbi:MAG TPA: purine-nucleoside phosphorylase [Gemmatimonadales bacterium]|nr:purine-nucleoside phosphorylase [Gemmatimonadales bacterium]